MGELSKTMSQPVLIIVCIAAIVLISGIVCLFIGIKKNKDNVVFLAKTHNDEREDMIKEMLKYMDPNKGTLFAQNVAFEKGRIKELAHIFPEYKKNETAHGIEHIKYVINRKNKEVII